MKNKSHTKRNIITFLKGFLMGTCDVVPGVSGGTIAFITGIYDRLIDALASFKPKLFKFVFKKEIKQARKHIDGAFLLALFSGIGVAIFSLAKIIKIGLTQYPSQVFSLFLGLLIASAFVLLKNIKLTKKNSFVIILLILIGITVGFLGTNFPLLKTEPTLLSTFFAGAVAIVAMILPGISGSYILLMINHYHHLIDIITNLGSTESFAFLGVFLLGALVGILSFAKFLSRIKKKYSNQVYAILTGIIIGALQILWPWKRVLETYTNSKGQNLPLLEEKYIPTDYKEILTSLLLIGIGFTIVILIEKFGKNKKNIKSK